ncbi:MAG: transposase [Planctomycetes bacterium]|nr:transposase [Planctomycetota bacterium]
MSKDKKQRSQNSPEVIEKASRRRFTAEYKTRILDEADRCTESGQVGELLRREGLYSSHLTNWRRQREAGLAPKQRGRKPKSNKKEQQELDRLRRENKRLAERLRQAETIIDVQKKVCEMLGIPTAQTDDENEE